MKQKHPPQYHKYHEYHKWFGNNEKHKTKWSMGYLKLLPCEVKLESNESEMYFLIEKNH